MLEFILQKNDEFVNFSNNEFQAIVFMTEWLLTQPHRTLTEGNGLFGTVRWLSLFPLHKPTSWGHFNSTVKNLACKVAVKGKTEGFK